MLPDLYGGRGWNYSLPNMGSSKRSNSLLLDFYQVQQLLEGGVSEKGKDDLALNTFTTNCDSDTEIYLLQCSRKLCFVEVWNNYRDVVGGFFCHLQMVKGGVSETRIEKRIVITGDADIDHDEVSMQT